MQEDNKKVPIYEVKPMKKGKKVLEPSDSRNKLEVNAKTHAKPKESHHKQQKTKEKEHKTREHKSRDREHKTKDGEEKPKEHKSKERAAAATAVVKKPEEPKQTERTNVEKVLHEDKAGIGRHMTKYEKNLNRNVKPPVVLVYADSVTAKDGVKQVLHEILNRDR